MKRATRIAIRIVPVLGIVISVLVWDAYAWRPIPAMRGKIAARTDITKGRYKELGVGLPVPWRPQYEALLRDRYGVHFEVVASCIVSEEAIDYVDAYDAISMNAINRKFGRDIFKEVEDEVSKRWKQSSGSVSKE